MAQQALCLNPLSPAGSLFEPARMGLAGIYGQLGREEEARAEAAALLRVNPNFSVEMWRQRFPAKDPAVADWWIDGLRKAGVK
jgi:hypothetical protein